jgi:hypothetical protein
VSRRKEATPPSSRKMFVGIKRSDSSDNYYFVIFYFPNFGSMVIQRPPYRNLFRSPLAYRPKGPDAIWC